MAKGMAPGKVILLGEHAVVYGKPGISASVNLFSEARARKSRRFTVYASDYGIESDLFSCGGKFEPLKACLRRVVEDYGIGGFYLEVSSQVPKGLGSSSSTALASLKAVGALYDLSLSAQELVRYVNIADEVAHGRASGIDASTVVYGGFLYFREGKVERINTCSLKALVIDSGVESSTREAVKRVYEFGSRYRKKFSAMLEKLEECVDEAREMLERGDMEGLGEKMIEYYSLLRETGISVRQLDEIVRIGRKCGIYAKPVGAWMGGCALGIGEFQNLLHAEREYTRRGYRSQIVVLGIHLKV